MGFCRKLRRGDFFHSSQFFLPAFYLDGSVAENSMVGLGPVNLGAMLLSDDTKCFAFLAGYESFAAAEDSISIVKNTNNVLMTVS